MTIKVLYFASLREDIGRSGDEFELSSDQLSSMNIEQLWRLATQQTSFPDQILIAVNQEYKDQFALVSDGDEVAFFPPVTGG